MAQITLYLPDEVARRIRAEAKKAKVSVSAYMASLATAKLSPHAWPPGFAQLFGSWEGDFPPVEDAPPDSVESLR